MYNQSCAAKGEGYASSRRPLFMRSMQRAAVNIFKTDASYEMLVFAPGRIKEHFKVSVAGNELSVSYTPPTDFPRPNWVVREYSRGGFVRSFRLDESVDVKGITARYEDGVLYVSLPLITTEQKPETEVVVQ